MHNDKAKMNPPFGWWNEVPENGYGLLSRVENNPDFSIVIFLCQSKSPGRLVLTMLKFRLKPDHMVPGTVKINKIKEIVLLKAWWKSLNQCLDLLFRPKAVLAELLENADLRPAGAALGVTSILLSLSTVVAEINRIPLAEQPPLDLAGYRWFQAAAMPMILASGCLASAAVCAGLGRMLRNQTPFRSFLAVTFPALLVPLWPMLWPTDLAVSLGILNTALAGFPGLWTRELDPALTVIYMLFLLWMAMGQVRGLLLRESFALAVMGLLPALGWWAFLLR